MGYVGLEGLEARITPAGLGDAQAVDLPAGNATQIGDINGDGNQDWVLVGNRPDNAALRAVFVIYGDGSANAPSDVLLDGTDGFRIDTKNNNASVAGAADVNGDGIGDLVLQTWQASLSPTSPPGSFGVTSNDALHIIYGTESGRSSVIDFALPAGLERYSALMTGTFSAYIMGDIDDDGADDLVIVGTKVYPYGDLNQQASILWGSTSPGSGFGWHTTSIKLDPEKFSEHYNTMFVENVGDYNGDGFDDLAVLSTFSPTPRNATPETTVHLIYGGPALSGLKQITIDAGSTSNAILLFDQATSLIRPHIAALGDTDDDGFDDFAIGEMGSENIVFHGQENVVLTGITFKNDRTAIFTDENGDTVTVKVNKGTLTLDNFEVTALGKGIHLDSLKLNDPQYAGATIQILAKASKAAGDGSVSVGSILAGGIDLKSVSVKGHLGSIVVGDSDLAKPGLGSLKVSSLGSPGAERAESVFTGGASRIAVTGSIDSAVLRAISGELGIISVGDSVVDSIIAAIGASDEQGTLRSLSIKGGLFGSQVLAGGENASIGSVKVGGDVRMSSLVAGASITGDPLEDRSYFDDALDGATIGKITIRGAIDGSSNFGDAFGFAAESIKKLRVSSANIPITDGLNIATSTDDVFLRIG